MQYFTRSLYCPQIIDGQQYSSWLLTQLVKMSKNQTRPIFPLLLCSPSLSTCILFPFNVALALTPCNQYRHMKSQNKFFFSNLSGKGSGGKKQSCILEWPELFPLVLSWKIVDLSTHNMQDHSNQTDLENNWTSGSCNI